jgi:aquaporin Z
VWKLAGWSAVSVEPPAQIARDQRRRDVSAMRGILGLEPPWARNFDDLSQEWRRLLAELLGTFLLVIVGAGAGVVAAYSGGQVSRTAAVVAPALAVMAIILSIGGVSGAHLNPVVSVAFWMRGEFPWKRVPGYVLCQLVGAVLACLFLWAMFGKVGDLGATLPGPHVNDVHAMVMEAALTLGLVTTILGTASGAQNVGTLSALAVAGYVALAGLWSSPISGASMNPARSFGPDAVRGDYTHFWPYLAGPTLGMLLAVGFAYALRGPGRDPAAARAAQGTLVEPELVVDAPLSTAAAEPPGPATQPAHDLEPGSKEAEP